MRLDTFSISDVWFSDRHRFRDNGKWHFLSLLGYGFNELKKIDFCPKLKIKRKLTVSKVSYIQMTHTQSMWTQTKPTLYRKYISGVTVVLWVKGTEYIWVEQLISHQGDAYQLSIGSSTATKVGCAFFLVWIPLGAV